MEFVETTEEIGDRIRRQLARIESHPLFVRSLRMRRFLEFTIEQRLAGKADELKEYVLGVEVFDRPPSHDPRLDPIVRVEARRLRAKLRDFYQSAGAEEELMIEYPLGSYVPRFQLRSTPPR
jgi:serine/threonine-protein kinase